MNAFRHLSSSSPPPPPTAPPNRPAPHFNPPSRFRPSRLVFPPDSAPTVARFQPVLGSGSGNVLCSEDAAAAACMVFVGGEFGMGGGWGGEQGSEKAFRLVAALGLESPLMVEVREEGEEGIKEM